MRPRIVDLNVDEIAWTPMGPAGLFVRHLSRDPETGARTALNRLSPDDGYVPPHTAHYHHTYEEIIGVSGCFSFDSRRWIEGCGYVFHPPRTVHGFASAIRAESVFLSRIGRDLDFNFIAEPKHDDLYAIDGEPPKRVAMALERSEALAAFQAGTFLGGDAEVRRLSVHPATGEGSALVKLRRGWASSASSLPEYLEFFVMEGGIGVDAEATGPRRAYFSYPPDETINNLAAADDVLVYVNFGGPGACGPVATQ